jgi:predicted glycoside hydrolase/deacetylase ChbG (UPF0249 family)
VTSTSIMATGPAFDHAVALAKSRPNLAVGVHLVLTEHRPLLGAAAAATLVERDGRFAPHVRQLLGKAIRGRVSLAEVRLELGAQLRRVREAGIVPSHIDGHQHVHVLPGIARVVADLAAEHGIRAVRYPAERVRGYMLRSLRLDEANLAMVLRDLPPGRTVELMCHPGHDDMQPADGWQYAWAAERDALTSPRIRELVAARGVQLVSYRDV